MINIYQFAHAHGLDVVVRNRSGIVAQGDPSYFYATIDRAEEKVGTCFLQSTFGNGATPAEAVRNYAKNISSQLLVIDAYTTRRREIRVPVLKLDEPADPLSHEEINQLRDRVRVAELNEQAAQEAAAGLEQQILELKQQRDDLQAELTAARNCLLREGMQRDTLLAALEKARNGLSGGLWDYGPWQNEHDKCNHLIAEIDAAIASVKEQA